ncbi:MAG: maleylpyruvate isomerase family mycothiol-dependent enzyme [Actinobacteria bacterium]|nr:maleylpyruvate isomerase family mycothiol-dependent enzyme [Actinomycetota bacterium]
MSLSPSSPALRMSDADVPTLIAAWEGSIRDFHDFVATLDDSQWNTMSPCPGWTVGDLAAHVVGIEREVAGDNLVVPEPEWASLTHVRDDGFSRYTEPPVDQRRGLPREVVIAELADVIDRRVAQLNGGDMAADSVATGPMGTERPLDLMLRMRCFDIWVHEQDARLVLDLPGHLGTAGGHSAAHTLMSALPFVLAKKVAAAPGTSLQLVVSGPVAFDRTVQVGDDGKARFVTTLAGEPGAPDGPTVRLTTDWLTFMLVACGRVDSRSPRVVDSVTIEGDVDLATRYLGNASITP